MAASFSRIHARPPRGFSNACRRVRCRVTPYLLVVHVKQQCMWLFQRAALMPSAKAFDLYPVRAYRISTSRFGIGQRNGSNGTPVGLHRIARKIGSGEPMGTVFRGRRPVGLTWQGARDTRIAHRILWLEGLEPGWNRGGEVDSFQRYIYIHGTGDEMTLGRPQSHGCVHLAASDLLPLYNHLPIGSLVWINRC